MTAAATLQGWNRPLSHAQHVAGGTTVRLQPVVDGSDAVAGAPSGATPAASAQP
jgi:hypothetical protein